MVEDGFCYLVVSVVGGLFVFTSVSVVSMVLNCVVKVLKFVRGVTCDLLTHRVWLTLTRMIRWPRVG